MANNKPKAKTIMAKCPPDLHRQLRIRAAQTMTTISDVILKALAFYLTEAA